FFGCPADPGDPDVNRVIRELAARPYVDLIRVRNPFARFDHRKLVLIDGRAAWTGGRNFTELSFSKFPDMSVKVEGPLVADLQECFDHYWRERGGKDDGGRGLGIGVRAR